MITILKHSEIETGSSLLSFPVSEDINELSGNEKYFDLEKMARELEEFKGETGKTILFYSPENINAKKALLGGIGKKSNLTPETLRQYGSNIVKQAVKIKSDCVDIIVPDTSKTEIDEKEAVKAIAEGAYLGSYSFDNYKTEKKETGLKKIRLISDNKDELSKTIELVNTTCKSVFFARDIATMAPNDKRPTMLKDIIVAEAEKNGLKTSVLNNDELEQKGFHSHLAVGNGSSDSAYLVVLEYTPEKYDETIALVGKGITFDSGGIDLKPPAGMENMKMDMGGAAAVSGAAIALAQAKPNKKIVTIIPIAENMPSGTAFRPGDVVKSYSGKTIEVLNTDAEGRLILADALTYAEKLYNPDIIIDAATLTGACMVALGEKIAGVFSTDDDLAQEIVKSGKNVHEPCWQMPVFEEYAKPLKSGIADLQNMGAGRYGGAITAALFLREFIETKSWAHIDIAGPGMGTKADGYLNKGGTGFGVRLLTDFVLNRQ